MVTPDFTAVQPSISVRHYCAPLNSPFVSNDGNLLQVSCAKDDIADKWSDNRSSLHEETSIAIVNRRVKSLLLQPKESGNFAQQLA